MLPDDMGGDEFDGEEGEEVNYTPSYEGDEELETTPEDENTIKDGMPVTCGGIIKAVKKITKGANTMAFLTIEDIYGNFDVSLFNRAYAKFKDFVEEDKMITVRGKISIREGKSPSVVADSIIAWDKQEEVVKQEKTVYLRFDTKNIDIYNRVKKIASSYVGDCPIVIKCTSSNKAFAFNAKVDPNNYLINELMGLLGEDNVIVR
ncbi:MAG: hypothetical protein IJX25_03350 [Clostridia bacterium]|nr:hypothetical protein [Clostridia bacterium]